MKHAIPFAIKATFFAMLLLPANSSFAHANHAAKLHAYDRSVVINFDKGGDLLTLSEQSKLRNLVNFVGIGNIDQVEVAAWADGAFPQNGEDLSKEERTLAENRLNQIHDFLKNRLSVSDVKTFNMAETSNWLARTLKTDESELKSSFSKEAAAPMAREDFNLIEREGAPTRAVVIVVKNIQSDY